MKYTYIPVQEPDGSWKMVFKPSPSQRIAAEKAWRRIQNIKDNNPWWTDPLFGSPHVFQVPIEWPWKPFNGGDVMQIPIQYSMKMKVENPRTSFVISGFNGI